MQMEFVRLKEVRENPPEEMQSEFLSQTRGNKG